MGYRDASRPLRAITSRMPSVATTFVVVCLLVAATLYLWPNRYGSDGLIYIRLGRGALSADPTAQNSSSVSLHESRTSEVVSIAEMIGSREIAERAVDRVGINEINAPRNWMDRIAASFGNTVSIGGRTSAGSMTADQQDHQLEREDAIERIRELISISVPKEGYTLAVNGSGGDPILVRSIVQAVMDEYKNFHVEAHRANGSLQFFEEQVKESRDAAMKAQEALQTTKSEMGWMSAELGAASLQERMIQLEVSLDVAESSLAEAKSHAQELQRRYEAVEEWVPTEILKGIANNAGDDMRSQLYGLQVEESEAIAKLLPSHPRYRMLQNKMTQSKQIMSEEGMEREQSVEALNPIRQQLETDYQTAQAKAAGLQGRRDAIVKNLDKAKQDLLRLNKDSITLAKLEWQCDIAEDNYLGHAKSLEEARVLAELDSQQMSDVSIIQDASLNLKKIGPPRFILLCVGAMIALLTGMLQAIIRDNPNSDAATVTSTLDNSSVHNGHESKRGPHDYAASERGQEQGYEQEVVISGAAKGAGIPR